MSHLLQMRGLKRLLYSYLHLSVLVASFTDAWIETSSFFLFILFFLVASFTDAWIETSHGCPEDTSRASHLLQMRGLKPKSTQRNFKKRCRIFYRCVD